MKKITFAALICSAAVGLIVPAANAATYTPEAGYYCFPDSATQFGSRVTLDSSGNANIGNGGDYWMSGNFIYTNGGYADWVACGVSEDHSGMFGSYWKRFTFINRKGGQYVDFLHPPYNPDNNNNVNTYAVYRDNAVSGRYRYTFNGQSNNEVVSNYDNILEIDAVTRGFFASSTSFSCPGRTYRNWDVLTGGGWIDAPNASGPWIVNDGGSWSYAGYWNDFTVNFHQP